MKLSTVHTSLHTGKQQGSVLIMVILSIVIIASIGAAIMTSTTTATYTQIGSVDTLKAYHLAETCKLYAFTYLDDDMESDRDSSSASGAISLLDGETFTLPSSTEQFAVGLTANDDCKADQASGDNCTYTLVCSGLPNSTTNRTVTYKIMEQ